MTKVLSFVIGFVLLAVFGITTDQIMQNVYDSANTALRVNRVAGGTSGTVTSTGSSPNLAAFTSSTNIGNYAGSAACAAGDFVTTISASGTTTCGTPTGGISGLTTNRVTKATSATAIGNSSISDDGTNMLATTILNQGTAVGALNSVAIGETAGHVTWEGTVDDAFESRLTHATSGSADVLTTIPAGAAAQTVSINEIDQTFLGVKTFTGGPILANNVGFELGTTTGSAKLGVLTALTPDAPSLWTGTVSNSYHVYEFADNAFDFNNGPCGVAACTDPTLIVHSNVQNTTGWLAAYHNATNAVLQTGLGAIQLGADAASPAAQTLKGPNGSGADKVGGTLSLAGGQSTGTGVGGDVSIKTSPSTASSSTLNTLGDRSKVFAKYTTLTAATPTAFARVAVATGTVIGGEIVVTVEANDSTNFQARTLRFGFSAVNKAGTTTTGLDTPSESVAVSAGTLTCTITAVDASLKVDFEANCTSSLTETTLRANAIVTAKNFGTGTISVQ